MKKERLKNPIAEYLNRHNDGTKKDSEIISCICLTCGVRNDHSNPTGYCQNDHDNWLEYNDVVQNNTHFKKALKLTGFSLEEFIVKFMDKNYKQFPIHATKKNQTGSSRN